MHLKPNWWKRIALVALLGFAALFVALTAVVTSSVLYPIEQQLLDERLIGEWQSDADRTIAGIREARSLDEAQEAKLRQIFGKMRVTYAPTTFTTVLYESTKSQGYKVLGQDQHSVVIQEIDAEPSPLDVLELSTFTVIQFDGPDSYWLRSKVADVQEWFTRVK
ncbi:MAG: hypothetical protein SH868_04375 [Bythopirellula sp.]|nr:hypothetical protein [Bythopirellula sp.]